MIGVAKCVQLIALVGVLGDDEDVLQNVDMIDDEKVWRLSNAIQCNIILYT